MENTEKVLFEDDHPQWYIALGENWVGPITASEVYERVTAQKISWAHFVWKPGMDEWKRLCDLKTFSAAVPIAPSASLQREVKESSKEIRALAKKDASTKQASAVKPVGAQKTAQSEASEGRGWFLYYNETQFGPFSKDEVARSLRVGKITPRVHAWRTGMSNWTRIEAVEVFKTILVELSSAGVKQAEVKPSSEKIEHRQTPRRPMIARILLANSTEVSDAVCRDISVGGMQVLTEQIPGQVGEQIRLNVSAAQLEPFVAEGVIVRVLEDLKGFSFRFEKISDQARRAIEQYIHSPQ